MFNFRTYRRTVQSVSRMMLRFLKIKWKICVARVKPSIFSDTVAAPCPQPGGLIIPFRRRRMSLSRYPRADRRRELIPQVAVCGCVQSLRMAATHSPQPPPIAQRRAILTMAINPLSDATQRSSTHRLTRASPGVSYSPTCLRMRLL